MLIYSKGNRLLTVFKNKKMNLLFSMCYVKIIMYRFTYFDLARVHDKNKNVFHNIYILFYNKSRKCI